MTIRITLTGALTMLASIHYSCKSQEVSIIREIDQMEMHDIPEGSFQRGSNDIQIDNVIRDGMKMYPEDNNCQREIYSRQEQSQGKVLVDGFWMDKTEVNIASYCAFLNENGNQAKNGIQWFEPVFGSNPISV